MDRVGSRIEDRAAQRRTETFDAAMARGLLEGPDCSIGCRVPKILVDQAKQASGIADTTALLTYALARIALDIQGQDGRG
jgi:hypothetical protein